MGQKNDKEIGSKINKEIDNETIEDRAKKILNILIENGVDIKNINYDKLEKLLWEANRRGTLKIF